LTFALGAGVGFGAAVTFFLTIGSAVLDLVLTAGNLGVTAAVLVLGLAWVAGAVVLVLAAATALGLALPTVLLGGFDFKGADLAAEALTGADFTEADLGGKDLAGGDFLAGTGLPFALLAITLAVVFVGVFTSCLLAV
jgi:hypothetical protein